MSERPMMILSFAKKDAALLPVAIARSCDLIALMIPRIATPERSDKTCAWWHVSRILTCTAPRTKVTSGGASFVTVVQAGDLPECDHVTLGDALHGSGRWRIFRQREMSPRSVIVRKIAGQNSAQMLLAEHHHVVQAVAPD